MIHPPSILQAVYTRTTSARAVTGRVALACVLWLVPSVLLPAVERPLTGISTTINVKKNTVSVSREYVRAVWKAGGLPVLLPNMHETPEAIEDLVARLDGLIIVGGADVPPEAYEEAPHETVKVMPDERWTFDQRLIVAWLKTDKPLLGICLGAQMTNVVLGGSLVQDIPSQVGKEVTHRKTTHSVNVVAGTRLAEILGTKRADVYSSHHQAVKRIGRNIRIAARSDDGVIEATELLGNRFGLLLQWHPERTDKPHRDKIFGAFIKAAVCAVSSTKNKRSSQ